MYSLFRCFYCNYECLVSYLSSRSSDFITTCLMLYSFQYLINILIVFELQIPCMTFNSRSYITISTIFVTTFTGIE